MLQDCKCGGLTFNKINLKHTQYGIGCGDRCGRGVDGYPSMVEARKAFIEKQGGRFREIKSRAIPCRLN